MTSIYKTPEGRAKVLADYDRRLAALPIDVTSRDVDTRFGQTRLWVAGPEGAAPVVFVHGANGGGVDMAAGYGSLAARHRCYYVDVPGEPNRSSETRPGKTGDGLGLWMRDVLDGLGLERTAMLGVSGGAFATLKCAAVIPERLSRVVLVVPEGLSAQRPLRFLRKVLMPMLRHRVSPTEANARRFVRALSQPSEPSAAAIAQLGLVIGHVKSAADRGPRFEAHDLARLEAPVFVVAAARDVIFPGEAAASRAREILPNLRDVLLLPDANHSSAEVFGPAVLARIGEFLAEDLG